MSAHAYPLSTVSLWLGKPQYAQQGHPQGRLQLLVAKGIRVIVVLDLLHGPTARVIRPFDRDRTVKQADLVYLCTALSKEPRAQI